MKKNVAWLNSRWWYRLIKVVYLLVLTGLVVFMVGESFAQNYPAEKYIDIFESKLHCTEGNKESFSFLSIGIERNDTVLGILNEKIVGVGLAAQYCELEPIPSRFDTSMFEGGSKGATDVEIAKARERIDNSYYTEVVYDEEGGLHLALWYSLLFSSIVIVFFEFIRRIFYYVVLGSVKPK